MATAVYTALACLSVRTSTVVVGAVMLIIGALLFGIGLATG